MGSAGCQYNRKIEVLILIHLEKRGDCYGTES